MEPLDRYAPLTGAAAAVLFGFANFLWFPDSPEAAAPAREISAFYVDHSSGIRAGAALSLIAVVLFLFFAGFLRRTVAQAEGARPWLASVIVAGAALMVASGTAAELINAAGAVRADEDGRLDPETAQVHWDLAWMFGFPGAACGAAAVLAALAVASFRTGAVLPSWLAVPTLLLAFACLIPPLAPSGLVVAVGWAVLVSVMLFRAEEPTPQ